MASAVKVGEGKDAKDGRFSFFGASRHVKAALVDFANSTPFWNSAFI